MPRYLCSNLLSWKLSRGFGPYVGDSDRAQNDGPSVLTKLGFLSGRIGGFVSVLVFEFALLEAF